MDQSEEERNETAVAEPVTVMDARVNLTDVVNRVLYRGERIPITRNGKTVAYLVSPDDFESWTRAA
ncbi:MAG: type II toxin-antitoxin system Phd/YefM family antitoxin [Polyangiaceae bacterium]